MLACNYTSFTYIPMKVQSWEQQVMLITPHSSCTRREDEVRSETLLTGIPSNRKTDTLHRSGLVRVAVQLV